MMLKAVTGAALTGMILLVLVAALSAVAASNTVRPSSVSDTSQPITANDLKPSECAALNLSNTVTGTGTLTGTLDNDLMLGSVAGDHISAELGGDCVLGGDHHDTLHGESSGALIGGDDVLLGGHGDDTIDGGPGTDICHGGPGTDVFHNCETIYQD